MYCTHRSVIHFETGVVTQDVCCKHACIGYLQQVLGVFCNQLFRACYAKYVENSTDVYTVHTIFISKTTPNVYSCICLKSVCTI